MLEHLQRLRLYTFAALSVLPPALGCLWVLLVRLGGPAPSGGWLWWFANTFAPWWLLAAGAMPLLRAGFSYALHRLDAKTGRYEGATGPRKPLPAIQRERARLGSGAVLLSVLTLWPHYLPEGALLWESTEIRNLPIADTARWEGGAFVTDRADHRVYTCTYLSFYGFVTETHALRPSYPHPCAYFYRRVP